MIELSEKELGRVRLAADYCRFCYEFNQEKPVDELAVGQFNGQHLDMLAFFHNMNAPFGGKDNYFFMSDMCIKCYESGRQKPTIAEFVEKHLPEASK